MINKEYVGTLMMIIKDLERILKEDDIRDMARKDIERLIATLQKIVES